MSYQLRVARAAINYPATRFYPGIVRHRSAASAGATTGAAPNLGVGGAVAWPGFVRSYPSRGSYAHWRPSSCSFAGRTMYTSAAEPNLDDAGGDLTADRDAVVEAEKNEIADVEDGVNAILPFQRSKDERKREGHSLDHRAQAKLAALSHAKEEAEGAKSAFLASKVVDGADNSASELHAKWNLSEQNLSIAYSHAIKYTSRIMKNEEATKTAERLLFQWVDRFLDPFDVPFVWINDDNESTSNIRPANIKRKKIIRTMHKIIPKLTSSETPPEWNPFESPSSIQSGDDISSTLPKIYLPPPTSKDFTNVLRAYSLSKARRKGHKCEALLANMMNLAEAVTDYYNKDSDKGARDKDHDVGMESIISVDGNTTERWRTWVNETIPNSKQFALAIKCHAGSTHDDSLERILLLNDVHDSFSKCCQSHVPGMYQDDPYVLFHSIKALKNLRNKEEWEKGQEWLRKLHKFVSSPENFDYFKELEKAGESESAKKERDKLDRTKASPGARANNSQTIDVTSAYTTMIRLMARLRGADGVAAEARKVLNRMHEVHDLFANGPSHSDARPAEGNGGTCKNEDAHTSMTGKGIACIDIRPNAYNLVLGLYRDSKKSEDSTRAIEILHRMVDAGNEAPAGRSGVPLPTELSFEFAILSLAKSSHREEAIQEAERLIQLMQDQDHFESWAAAYNSLITVCNKQMFGKPELFDKALDILHRMDEMSKTKPGASPNRETLALVMKACSLSEHGDGEKVLGAVSKLFSRLKEQETSERTALALTDRAYFYMMKCVDMYMVGDQAEKKDRIEELFSEACQRGLCSADVLTLFRNSVSEEDYRLTVGEGRLASHWIANITGPRALFTDGSKGGAGKHARRKGKSTSDWLKKKKMKDSQRQTQKEEKRVKKFFKNGKGSSKKKMAPTA